jgi:hypothetical protein
MAATFSRMVPLGTKLPGFSLPDTVSGRTVDASSLAGRPSGKAGAWFDKVLSTLGKSYSWTFWCWNPNSGDTAGLLGYDWVTPVQWKIEALAPAMAPMIGN